MTAEKRDLIAETMWRAEYTRATGKERSIPWSEVAYDDQQKYLYVADVVAAALSADEDDVRNAVIEECAKCVPTTWLDPLLTGPKKVAEFEDCPSVERLLQAIAARIRALSTGKRDD